MDGSAAATWAARLLAGEQIADYARHHAGVRHILGLSKGDGLTASRTCAHNCPSSWLARKHPDSSGAIPYRVCVPSHYVAESLAANLARKERS